jgi:hypothetical protein
VTVWARPGAPVSLLVLGAWLHPFMGAGVVRTLAGWSMAVGFVVALGAELLLGAMFLARPSREGDAPDATARALKRAGLLVGLAMVGWAFSLLYNRGLGGQPAFFGVDGGSHVAFRRMFVKSDPKVYAGFVSLYSATHLLDRLLPLGPTGSFALAFYATVAVVVVAPIVAMVTLLQGRPEAREARLVGLGAFAIAWSLTLKSFGLPLLSNMQVDGFYGHFFGFLPFALVWLADVLLRPVALRILWTGLAVMVCRFTYGLNLADLLLACGGLWLFDLVAARRRAIPLLAAAGAIGAGFVAYRNLGPVFVAGGYVEVYDLELLLKMMRPVILILGAYGLADALWGARAPESPGRLPGLKLLRAIRLPLVFALVGVLALEQLSKIPACENYYRLKYPMMPLVWLGAAGCLAIGYVTLVAVARTTRPVLAVAGITAILGMGYLSAGLDGIFTSLQVELAERNAPPPHARLRPLVDPDTWKTIATTLHADSKAFGGYISSDYPTAHFLNSMLEFDTLAQLFVPPNVTPGHCVFWTHREDDVPFAWTPQRASTEATRAQLEADPLKLCQTFEPRWTVAPRSLCHRCY